MYEVRQIFNTYALVYAWPPTLETVIPTLETTIPTLETVIPTAETLHLFSR